MALGPRMGGGGGFRYDENERNQDDEQTSQALNRGKYEPSFVMNSDAYVGGQSRQQEERDAYERDAGHTRPQMSRKEEADLARLQEAARNIGDIKPPSQQQEPEQAKQSSQDQPRQSRNPFDNAESQQRQFDLSARLRGRMDALEANGGEKFGERKGFGSERMFSIARESFQQTTSDIDKGKFGAMADRARAAAGHGTTQEQGQSQQAEVSNTPSANPRSRFGGMADRASAASQATQTETTKKDGLEQR
ncbi:hypothetical protein [Agrobacterium radiobacter]|uniref:hypothetical protein n=1 Tax=Agrobacterium radiobacter TaxID=362 RepID=UPI003CE585F5